MKHFDKLKDQIRQEQSGLPDGFGWDDMKDDIYSKMEEDPRPSRFPFLFLNKFMLVGIGFLIGIVFISFLFLHRQQNSTPKLSENIGLRNDIDKSNVSENDASITQNLTSQSVATAKPAGESAQLQKPSINTTQPSKSIQEKNAFKNTQQIQAKENKEASSIELIQDSKPALNQIEFNTKLNSSKKSVNQSSTKVDVDAQNETAVLESNITRLNTDINPNATLSTGSNNETDAMASNKTELISIEILPILTSYVQGRRDQINLNSPESNMISLITPTQQNLWTLEFGGGWNTWSYGRSNSQEKNSLYSDTKGEYGFSFSSRLSRSINQKFSLTSGLDLDIMYKKLDAAYTTLDERFEANVVIGHAKNAISGVNHEIIRDTTLIDTTMRTVISYNKYQVVSIPIIVNYTLFKKSNWSLDIGFGPSISFLTNYQGLYVDNNELLSFDKSSNLYSSTPKVALNSSLNIRKGFSNNFFFGLRVDYKNHLSNWASDNTNEIKPKVVSGSVVVGKVF